MKQLMDLIYIDGGEQLATAVTSTIKLGVRGYKSTIFLHVLTAKRGKTCPDRESNPGRPRGMRGYFHYTIEAS